MKTPDQWGHLLAAVSVPTGPIGAAPKGDIPKDHRQRVLEAELEAAGVVLGWWDRAILFWLSAQDWPTVAAVASWVHRAAQRPGCGCDGDPIECNHEAEAGAVEADRDHWQETAGQYNDAVSALSQENDRLSEEAGGLREWNARLRTDLTQMTAQRDAGLLFKSRLVAADEAQGRLTTDEALTAADLWSGQIPLRDLRSFVAKLLSVALSTPAAEQPEAGQ